MRPAPTFNARKTSDQLRRAPVRVPARAGLGGSLCLCGLPPATDFMIDSDAGDRGEWDLDDYQRMLFEARRELRHMRSKIENLESEVRVLRECEQMWQEHAKRIWLTHPDNPKNR